ncbi:amino acid adenylation domain-containing protein [Metabacillus sp. Hm71]|uniref:amino acid adenylation domain-containing protein n=1 Tax=Metabacillus sp. Hm71 TaxID=3450743 RepID=UPI003F420B56
MSTQTYNANLVTEEEQFWLNKLSGDWEMNSFAQTAKKNELKDAQHDTFTYQFPKELSRKIIKISNQSETGLFIILMCGVKYLLSIYSKNEDVSIGTPAIQAKTGAAYQDHPLIIRSKVQTGMSFKELLFNVQHTIAEAHQNQKVSHDRLAALLCFENATRLRPLTIVQLENIQPNKPTYARSADTIFHFTWDGNDIECSIAFKKDIGEIIEQITDQLTHFYQKVIDSPNISLSDIELLSEEKKRILHEFIDTGTEFPMDKTVVELFEEQVSKTPQETAIVFQGKKLSYEELNKRANRTANELVKIGAKEGKIIGLIMDRSLELPISILGVLKTGAAYLPIDPNYPKERIEKIISNSNVDIVVKDSRYQKQLMHQQTAFIDVDVICQKDLPAEMEKNLNLPLQPDGLLYVLYTSGSTGEPKGVMVKRNSFANLLHWYTNEFDMNETDNVLLIAPISFDTAHKNFIAPLIKGAQLHIFEPGVYDYNNMSDYIHLHKITSINCTPSGFYPLVEYNKETDYIRLASLKHVFLGGEPIHSKRLKPLAESLNFTGEIVNTYGPTECTDISSFYRIKDEELIERKEIPIGKPLNNVKIYIVDHHLRLLPIGVIGELCISGAGLSKGYYNAPGLTKEKFVDFPAIPGKKVYRTGDLARWTADGNLEFIGRKDNLTKIRGFRIEVGEIEACLLKHHEVEEAVVVAKEDRQGTKELCAYFVAKSDIPAVELRDFLMKRLPDFMIPAYFTQLNKMPLNQNGKIDRKKLPEPELKATVSSIYVAPENELERKIAQIWGEVLQLKKVGRYDHFFEIGGHSLKAASVVLKINQEFSANLQMSEMFKQPTIKDLASLLSENRQYETAGILPVKERAYYPVSSQQKRLYIMWQLNKDSLAYNLPTGIMIEGDLDTAAIQKTFQILVNRHEILRTSFSFADGQLVQHVHPMLAISVNCIEADQERLMEVVRSLIKPFHLEKPPLIRINLIKIQENQHLLVTDAHHIVFDGLSMDVLMEEFTEIYEGKDLPNLKVQYRDYAVWQEQFFQTEHFKRKEKYWLDQLSTHIPSLELRTDYPRRPVQKSDSDLITITASSDLTSRLKEAAMENGTTLYMMLLSALNVLFAKYTGQEEIVIGSPTAGRSRPGLEKMIGMLANTVVMRNFPRREKLLREFINEVKNTTLEALDHEEYPFEVLVDQLGVPRNTGRNPVFDIAFSLDRQEDFVRNSGHLAFRSWPIESKMVQFDLFLHALETNEDLTLKFKFRTDLFKRETVERIAGHFLHLLDEMTIKGNSPIKELELISDEEKQMVLSEFNETKAEFFYDRTVQEIVEQQAKERGAKAAVFCNGKEFTYTELDERSNQLANLLRSKGVKRNSIVALMVRPSFEMVIGVLGVLKAGGAFLPIDPNLPPNRISYLVKDSRCQLILTTNTTLEQEAFDQEFIELTNEMMSKEDNSQPENINQPDDLAYVIYTSGTTGKPKGVMIEHRNLVNQLVGLIETLQFDEDFRHLLLAKLTFDVSVQQILLPILSGGTLYIPEREVMAEPKELWRYIKDHHINMLGAVPSHLKVLIHNHKMDHELRCIFVAGEVFTKSLYDQLRSSVHAEKVMNLYGPTEATIFSTSYCCNGTEASSGMPIGKPLSHYRAYIVDKDLKIVPLGAIGELCIAGAGVARGYINNPSLTKEKFIPDPFVPGERMYKTGDLARWLPDGNIEYLGRIDHQVKINGIRVEPDEVKNHLLEFGAFEDAVVITKQNQHKENYLCAYFVTNKDVNLSDLRDYLKMNLPEYMIPSHFVRLEKMPVSSNGKIDVRVLQERKDDQDVLPGATSPAPDTQLEKTIAEIWKQVLGIHHVGIHDHFFDLGGNSLNIVQVNERLKEVFQIDLAVVTLFRHTTIADLAKHVKSLDMENEAQTSNTDRVQVMEASKSRLKQRRQRKRDWNES